MDTHGVNNPSYKHGHTEGRKFSPTYSSWAGMVVRCYNPNRKVWKHYGGRGITVCDRWRGSFENFLADMGERPDGTSLDRIDVNGNYEPGNCRWANTTEQARNSRQAVWVEFSGVRERLVDLCERLGISINTVRNRVKYKGFTYETAIQRSLELKLY